MWSVCSGSNKDKHEITFETSAVYYDDDDVIVVVGGGCGGGGSNLKNN